MPYLMMELRKAFLCLALKPRTCNKIIIIIWNSWSQSFCFCQQIGAVPFIYSQLYQWSLCCKHNIQSIYAGHNLTTFRAKLHAKLSNYWVCQVVITSTLQRVETNYTSSTDLDLPIDPGQEGWQGSIPVPVEPPLLGVPLAFFKVIIIFLISCGNQKLF